MSKKNENIIKSTETIKKNNNTGEVSITFSVTIPASNAAYEFRDKIAELTVDTEKRLADEIASDYLNGNGEEN